MIQKGNGQAPRATHSFQTVTNGTIDGPKIFHAAVGHFLPFEVSPKGLKGIQFRPISGQSFHTEPTDNGH